MFMVCSYRHFACVTCLISFSFPVSNVIRHLMCCFLRCCSRRNTLRELYNFANVYVRNSI